MKAQKVKTYYERNLPHIQAIGDTFFVTFRLKGSIPRIKLKELKENLEERKLEIKRQKSPFESKLIYEEQKRYFAKYDALLDAVNSGPTYLKEPAIAEIIAKEMHRFDEELYDLIAYTIMPNHVHLLINTSIQLPDIDMSLWDQLDVEPLNNIMKKIKGPSAIYSNRALGREGKFWQRESYDHYVRNPLEQEKIIAYILNNPVKARLATSWEKHPFTYMKT